MLPTICLFVPLLVSPLQNADMKLAKSLTKSYETALMARNFGWFEKNCTPDYQNITSKRRRQDRDTAFADMKAAFASVKKLVRVKITPSLVRREEGGLLVVCDVFVAGYFKGQPKLVESKQYEEDLWVPQGSRWLLKRTRTVTEKVTVGGKKVP